jgi:hypothetical protein
MIATVEQLTEQARERTGLADFGPDGWQEGLAQLVAAVRTDIGDDPDAVSRIEAIIQSQLVRRLRVEEWYADHGEEAADPVEGPLVLVGLPRTATTALNYLLAVDPQFRYPRSWEVNDPVPPVDIATEQTDPRRRPQHREADARHIVETDGPIEDGPIHTLHFHSAAGLPVPSYQEWWRDADLASSFAYHEHFLRLLHSHRPPHYWLLKSPSYPFHLPNVVAHYPNARLVMTHRDPVAVIPSTCSVMIDGIQRRLPDWLPEDPAGFGQEVLEHFAEGARRAVAARADLGDERFLDVGQHDLEIDPIATVERVYDFADLDLHDDVRKRIATWADENRRGSRGEHRYSAADYGLTAHEIREAFTEYLDAFGAYCAQDA